MKRSRSISDECNEANKRRKVEEASMQWFEIADLFGAFIKLTLPDKKILLNLSETSKTFWRQLHSKEVWQAAGFSLYYYNDQVTKEELKAILRNNQCLLDKEKINSDVASSDTNKIIGAVRHLNCIIRTDSVAFATHIFVHAGLVDPILQNLLAFIDTDKTMLQVACIDLLSSHVYSRLEFINRLFRAIITTKSPEVKSSALRALLIQFTVHQELPSHVEKNEDLLRSIIESIATDGTRKDILISCLHLIAELNVIPKCPWNLFEPAVSSLLEIISESTSDADVVAKACLALNKILRKTCPELKQIKSIMEPSTLNRFIDLLSSNKVELQSAGITLLHSISVGPKNANTDLTVMAAPNFLDSCKNVLQSSSKSLRNQCQDLLALYALDEQGIQYLLDSDLIMQLLLDFTSTPGAMECDFWAIVNMVNNASELQIQKLIELNAVQSFPAIFKEYEKVLPAMLIEALDALTRIFQYCEDNGLRDAATGQFEKVDGTFYLGELQRHESETIYEKTIAIFNDFFS